jgi:hypothetical protein
LGIKARKNGDECIHLPELNSECSSIYMDCCKNTVQSNLNCVRFFLDYNSNLDNFLKTMIVVHIFARMVNHVKIQETDQFVDVHQVMKKIQEPVLVSVRKLFL